MKKRISKLLAAALALCMVLPLLSACGDSSGGAAAGGSAAPGPSGEPVTCEDLLPAADLG